MVRLLIPVPAQNTAKGMFKLFVLDYTALAEIDPTQTAAIEAKKRLPAAIQEKQEKEKEQMIRT